MSEESNLDFARCVEVSERVAWRLDDVMPKGTRLDFSLPFLPEALARTAPLSMLDARERKILNQITANSYLNAFAFVEEYIIATMMDHARAELYGDKDALRALTRVAEEEIKHQQLFHRFRRAFEDGFGTRCGVLEDASEVAGAILSKSPIAILLVTFQLELTTQHHYLACARNDDAIDAFFVSLLKHHWIEEAQHARVDQLELEKQIALAPGPALEYGVDEYFEIVEDLAAVFARQAAMDTESLAVATGRILPRDEREAVTRSRRLAYEDMFLRSGLVHATFLEMLRRLDETAPERAEAFAKSLGVAGD
ncbi:MAG: diiron oxygenase [Myxococcota bacterium]